MLIRELVQQYNALSAEYSDAVLNLNKRAMSLMPFKPGDTSDGEVVEACERYLMARERFYAFGVERVERVPDAGQSIQEHVANKHGI